MSQACLFWTYYCYKMGYEWKRNSLNRGKKSCDILRYTFRIAIRYKFLVYCDISIYCDTPSIDYKWHLTLSKTIIARKHMKLIYSLSIAVCIFLVGAAKGLFEEGYYISMKEALRPNGIICCQGTPEMCKHPNIVTFVWFLSWQQRWRGYSNAAVHVWLGEWVRASTTLCLVGTIHTTVFADHRQTLHVSCIWWEEKSYRFWVTGSKVKVIFGTLSIKSCSQDTNYSTSL